MGFTPLEGLVMATRAGNTDPGLLLWLLRDGGLTLDELAEGLEQRLGPGRPGRRGRHAGRAPAPRTPAIRPPSSPWRSTCTGCGS